MWADMAKIWKFLYECLQSIFALYLSIGILSAVLVIYLVRRVLRTFNLI